MTDEKEWTPPDWMDPVLVALGSRDEMVRLLSGRPASVQVNAPLALMQQAAEAQAQLLAQLFGKGLLNTDACLRDQLAQVDAQISRNEQSRSALVGEMLALGKRQTRLLQAIDNMEGIQAS